MRTCVVTLETPTPGYFLRASSMANRAPRSDGRESRPHIGTIIAPDFLAASPYFTSMASHQAVSPVMSA
jgi:hypothetical protein